MADEQADQQSAVIAFRASVPDRKWTGPASARHWKYKTEYSDAI